MKEEYVKQRASWSSSIVDESVVEPRVRIVRRLSGYRSIEA